MLRAAWGDPHTCSSAPGLNVLAVGWSRTCIKARLCVVGCVLEVLEALHLSPLFACEAIVTILFVLVLCYRSHLPRQYLAAGVFAAMLATVRLCSDSLHGASAIDWTKVLVPALIT